jgi:hypothetical protein
MPFPQPGDGAIIGTVGQVLPIGVLYLCPQLTPATPPPAAALGTTEPGTPWVRMGLLRDEQLVIDEKDPDTVEYRRGFKQRYFGEVIRKSGERTLTATMDEVEPLVIAKLNNDTTNALGSPAQGWEIDLVPSQLLNRTMLFVFYDAQSSREFQIYSPNALVRFKIGRQAEFMTIDLTIKLIPFINIAGEYADMKYYAFKAPGSTSF